MARMNLPSANLLEVQEAWPLATWVQGVSSVCKVLGHAGLVGKSTEIVFWFFFFFFLPKWQKLINSLTAMWRTSLEE